MATFIPGMTDVFSDRLSFKPDWNRVERGLMLRSAAYTEGARKVKSLYDSVFQSAMLREGNVKRRDAYLQEISEGLKKASTLDLSILQNQENAMRLFEPLQNDKQIIKDILWTRNYQKQASEAEALRTSSNPETRRQYWETGMKYLQYQAEDFMKADDNTALSMSSARYVPNVDLVTLANKMYKDMGISVEQDVMKGGYIWTQKNGQLAVPLTQSMVNTMFASDPAIQDMLRVQAYVQRKDFIKANATQYGGEEGAERYYANEILSTVGAAQQEQVIADSEEVKDLRARKASWDKIITTRGIIPDSDEHKKYLTDLEKLKAAEKAAIISRNQSTTLTTADPENINDLRSAADAAVVMASYSSTANKLATFLAYKNASTTAKSDPIYMAKLNSQLALNRSLVMENVRHANKIAFMDEQLKRGITPGSGSKKDKEEEKKKKIANLGNSLFGNQSIVPSGSNTGTGATADDLINDLLDDDGE